MRSEQEAARAQWAAADGRRLSPEAETAAAAAGWAGESPLPGAMGLLFENKVDPRLSVTVRLCLSVS
jgi:hypothetical protein